MKEKNNMYIYFCKINIKRMRLLVTGGYGFIGSHFVNSYFNNTSLLVNLDAKYYCANEENVKKEIRENEKYMFVHGNCSNSELVRNILVQYQITHIIHFAAQSHVQNSFQESLQYTSDNIVGTHVLLECSRNYGKISKFVHVSTDEVYGESLLDAHETHKTEQSILCPTNPYAATKAGAELIAQSYQHSYQMPIIITRGNNVYGSNQYPEKLIPRFIEQLCDNKKVTIQGDGSCVRAFLHVTDTVHAYIKVLEKGEIGEIYNIGCDKNMEYSVLDVAKLLIEKIQKTKDYDKWISYIEDRPFNDKRYYISNDKIKKLGWSVDIPFEKGIDMILMNKTN
jgi:dTDP-glucose 4,6-dehydratase